MVIIINFLLRITWKTGFGTKLKYRFKKLDCQFKKVSWSISLYSSLDDFQDKGKWKKVLSFYWFSLINKHSQIEFSGFADPFLIIQKEKIYLFYEAITNKKGEIWSAEIVNNELQGIQRAICEPFHLSYPNVFVYKEQFYMIPESSEDISVRLYKAVDFPAKWQFCKILHEGSRFADTNLLELENTYYWFTFDLDLKLTRIFYSESISSEWIEHKQSPIVSNRNAGNFIFTKGEIIRPVQISKKHYGEGVKLLKIVVLNKEEFQEVNYIDSFLSSEKGYNLDGTHHISLVEFENRTIIASDGKNNNYYSIV